MENTKCGDCKHYNALAGECRLDEETCGDCEHYNGLEGECRLDGASTHYLEDICDNFKQYNNF